MTEGVNSSPIPIDFYDYDFENDSLLFNCKNLQYESSIDLGNIILDMGVDGRPVGFELLHVSRMFGVPKSAIKNFVKFDANISISEEVIEMRCTIIVPLRNRKTEKIAVSQGINDINVPSAQIAMAY